MFGLVTTFAQKAIFKIKRPVLRVSRQLNERYGPPIPRGFFDDYPLFFETSKTSSTPNRLNQRFRACIEWNKHIIAGKRILDLASHDGRWSFAALSAGAKSITGIEARDYLVENANKTFEAYGVPSDCYRFICGDVFEQLDHIEPGSLDVVFLFGIFYHIENHALLLTKLARLGPAYLIVDTAIYLDPDPVVLIWNERTEGEANAAPVGSGKRGFVITGAPSRSAMHEMLLSFGWSCEYYEWHRAGIMRWDDLVDYQEGRRTTLRIKCQTTPPAG